MTNLINEGWQHEAARHTNGSGTIACSPPPAPALNGLLKRVTSEPNVNKELIIWVKE